MSFSSISGTAETAKSAKFIERQSMNDYTIAETFTIPSKGRIYGVPVNPEVKLRSMTTADEMKRVSHTDFPYKAMAELIDSCIVGDKPGISAYDMCIGDYQFLMHRLRVVTYGSSYKMAVKCPICDNIFISDFDLDTLKVYEYDDSYDSLMEVSLPQTKAKIRLKMQTPRIIEGINTRKSEMMKKGGASAADPTYILTLMAMIDTVNGESLPEPKLDNFVRRLPMMDANILTQKYEKFCNAIGVGNVCTIECPNCKEKFSTSFRLTTEFFRPSID